MAVRTIRNAKELHKLKEVVTNTIQYYIDSWMLILINWVLVFRIANII